jgi:hypothetical protein
MSTMIKKRCYRIAYVPAAIALLLLSSVAFAQDSDSRAVKFDEFGDIQASDLIARLDNLAIQLQNEPKVKAFLVVYRTRRDLPGLSNRYAHRMRSYLVQSRGLPAERAITVDGGEASCLVQELWIVGPGGAPQPRPDAYTRSYQPSVYKFDEHNYSPSRGPDGLLYWQEPPEYLLGYLEAFALELQKNPKAHGYLVAYKSTQGGVQRDAARVAQTMLRKERAFLGREFGIKPSRIKTIDGGYRGWSTMELWIGQGRGGVPIITSYRYSRRRKQE